VVAAAADGSDTRRATAATGTHTHWTLMHAAYWAARKNQALPTTTYM
jgi:hypothetical protein